MKFLIILLSSIIVPSLGLTKIPSEYNFKGDKLSLVGEKKVTIFFFDIYHAAFYTNSSKKKELLTLHYLRDISRSASIKGWKKSFDTISGRTTAKEWIYKYTGDMKKGDVFKMWKLHDSKKTILYKNDQLIATTENLDVFFLIHHPWIGPEPLDKNIKSQLLGNK